MGKKRYRKNNLENINQFTSFGRIVSLYNIFRQDCKPQWGKPQSFEKNRFFSQKRTAFRRP
ncbi:hypothetical protein, partial [Ruminococcus sp.]|uniref:hypothetical protein n=1 Tax=Ruminococcus sp. TaxID=41978 RepID=UPI003FEFB8E2